MGVLARPYCHVPIHPGLSLPVLTGPARATMAEIMLQHLQDTGLQPSPDWPFHCVAVRCDYAAGLYDRSQPLPIGEAPLAHLMTEVRPLYPDAVAPWHWILTVDAKRITLGQIPPRGALPPFVQAAAGRPGP